MTRHDFCPDCDQPGGLCICVPECDLDAGFPECWNSKCDTHASLNSASLYGMETHSISLPCGCTVELTREQVISLRGKVNAALSSRTGKGRPPIPAELRCPCGRMSQYLAAKRRHVCTAPEAEALALRNSREAEKIS